MSKEKELLSEAVNQTWAVEHLCGLSDLVSTSAGSRQAEVAGWLRPSCDTYFYLRGVCSNAFLEAELKPRSMSQGAC